MTAAVLIVVCAAAAWAAPATRPATQPAKDGPPPRREIDRAPLPPVAQVVELEGEDRNEAIRLRDAADLARAGFEKRYRAHPKPFPPEADAEFEEVAAAYREVSSRFPGSEMDCYCRICLGGAYLYRGKPEQAVDEAKQAAERFAGTRLGLDADMTVARFYLNPLRDPARAATWLLRVQNALPQIKDADQRQKMQTAYQQATAELEKLKLEPR
jgi:hypothetical protein